MTPSLHTRRLELRPASAAALGAALESDAALGAALGAAVPASWPPELYDADAVRWTLAQLGERADGGPFGSYYLILRPDDASTAHDLARRDTVIGVGGFKGPPDERGEVELGYAIVPEFQRRGHASEAVGAWLARAFAEPAVSTVVGQTLASLVASIGVLEKAGFRHAGMGEDGDAPVGERVVRYEITREEYIAAARRDAPAFHARP